VSASGHPPDFCNTTALLQPESVSANGKVVSRTQRLVNIASDS